MSVLGTPNLFRDMSGRAEVAELLKKLSDNTIGIAEAANRARQIQSNYGNASGATAGGQTSGGGIGGTRAAPNEPSRATRDLHDLQQILGQAQNKGLLSPEEAQSFYKDATREALGLQQVGDIYTPSASAKNELVGLVGEINLSQALESNGLIVFREWKKHVSATGIDLVAFDPQSQQVWLLDNKAQMKGISGANALTGDKFSQYKDQIYNFLKNESPHPGAEQAAELLNQGKFKKVVANGWAGKDTRFTKKVFESGLHVYDIRLGKLFEKFADWEDAFKAFRAMSKGIKRLRGMRGAANVEATLLLIVVSGTTLYALRSDAGLQGVIGEIMAETALNAALSRLPGGFFAGFVLGMESDETPRQRNIRVICDGIPGFYGMTAAEQQAVSVEVGKLLDEPLEVPDLLSPPARKQILPGLPSPNVPTDWA